MATGKLMLKSNSNIGFNSKSISKKLWKRSFFYFICALILVLVGGIMAVGGYIIYFYNFKKFPPPPDVSHILPHLKNGDIILRSGVGFWSEQFRQSNIHDKRFSHVGIVLIDKNGTPSVLHAEGNDFSGNGQVAVDTLENFVGRSIDIGISRLHSADPDEFTAHAQTFLKVPFDWQFNTQTSTEIYCTELIDLALKRTLPGSALQQNQRGIIVPEACLDKRYFNEIPLTISSPSP